jgi:tRNA-binding EMAP/Myf-like protein
VFVNPNADGLYVEEIDLGEAKPRQVVSGLAKFVPIEKMQGALVLVLCNLKASKLRGYNSEAMVLAASNDDHTAVELVHPPSACAPGDRVYFPGYENVAPDAVLNPKKKIFEGIKPHLKSNADRVAVFQDGDTVLPFTTAAGVCFVSTMSGAAIS